MNEHANTQAARTLWHHWQQGTVLAALDASCRPADRAQGYAVQAQLARLSGQPVVGWKIAATSIAGQHHIGVDGPLAGRLLGARVLDGGAIVPFAGNRMSVAECEFGFRMAHALGPREAPYTVDEVVDAIDTMHLTIEIPDSRYEDFVHAGAPQLIADCACACWLVAGPAIEADWRGLDLSRQEVLARVNGEVAARGSGANVLGDPRVALTWIANELRVHAGGLRVGDLVTTGTCVTPVPVKPGDRLESDAGVLGVLQAHLGGN